MSKPKHHKKTKSSVSDSMPMTTEEPVRRHWLSDQLKDINENDSADLLEDCTTATGSNKTETHKQHSINRSDTKVPIVITPPIPTDQTHRNTTDDIDNGANKINDEQSDSDDDNDEDSPDTDMENEINDSEDNSGEDPTVVTPPTTPSTSSSTPKTTTTTDSSLSTATSTSISSDEVQKPVPLPNLRHGSTQMDLLWNEMEQLQYNNGDNEYASDDASDDESDLDDELRRITEANRHIYLPDTNTPATTTTNNTVIAATKSTVERSKSISDPNLRNLLVFSDTHLVTQRSDRKVVSTIYGAGPQGNLVRTGASDIQLRQGNNSSGDEDADVEVDDDQYNRHYLVACDFSHESLHAMEWTMGTMLRDHDAIHIVTIANREDNPDLVNQTNTSVEKDLDASLNAVIDEAKKRLSRMMLYDIKLVFYSMVGRVKDALKLLIRTLPLTMVVCGSRGRGTMKGMLMGSVSTYLVHKSLIPVTVIRSQKKKKKEPRHVITATPLSESVKTGQLHVDELG